jgi:prepilin-type N-terminal cleavage/methylation domain-containing protein
MKAPPEAIQPKARSLGWIGLLLAIVGVAKLGDAFLMMDLDDPFRAALIQGSTSVIGLGALLMLLHWLFGKTKTGPRSLTEIRSKAKASSREKGFTLMEVIVTLALVALLFSMVAGILVSVLNVSEQISVKGDGEKIGYGVLGLVQRDIEGCVAYGLGPVIFKGEDKSVGGQEGDEIFFVTTSPGSVFESEEDDSADSSSSSESSNSAFSSSNPTDPNDPDASQAPQRPQGTRYRKVSYALRESPDADKGSGEERYVLCRRSVKLTKDDRDVTSGSAPYVEVVDGLKSFKVEYKETLESSWEDGWETPDKLPAAVRFTIEVAVPFKQIEAARAAGLDSPKPRRFQTVARILAVANIPEAEEDQ